MSKEQTQFKKGNTGRPVGSKNKATKKVKELICDFLDNNFTKFQSEMDALSGKEYVTAYLKLIEYSVPKMRGQTVDVDIKDSTVPTINYLNFRELTKNVK